MFFSCLALLFTGNFGGVLLGVGTLFIGVAALLGVLFWQKDLRIEAHRKKEAAYEKLRFNLNFAASNLFFCWNKKDMTNSEKVRTATWLSQATHVLEEQFFSISKKIQQDSNDLVLLMCQFVVFLMDNSKQKSNLSFDDIRRRIREIEKQMEKELRIPFDIVHSSKN